MTHTGAGPHALSPAHVCTCAQAIATFRSRSSRVCDSAGLLSVQIVTGGTERRLGVLLFVFLPSDDVSDESAPPQRTLTLPRATVRPQRPRAHWLPPLGTHPRAHKHTHI